jgi:hypothetical protein
MLELLQDNDPNFEHRELAAITGRLQDFAREMETLGLPWAASHVRNVVEMVAAERNLTAAFRS